MHTGLEMAGWYQRRGASAKRSHRIACPWLLVGELIGGHRAETVTALETVLRELRAGLLLPRRVSALARTCAVLTTRGATPEEHSPRAALAR